MPERSWPSTWSVSRPGRGVGWLVGLCLLLLGGLLLAGWARADDASDAPVVLRLATLSGAAGERAVGLPHTLGPQDFDPAGGRVRYRIQVPLAHAPQAPLGLYIPKMSLSGELWLNGQWLGRCGIGPLERLRCLHQPQWFVPPTSMWRAGLNTLEIEVFANERQMNGLSAVHAGPAEALHDGAYRWHRLWRVDLIRALSWLSICVGLLSLTVGAVLRSESVYRWFGLACLVNALSNLNVLVIDPLIDPQTMSWLVFSSRMASLPLILLTQMALFQRDTRPWRLGLLHAAWVLPLLVALSGNHRGVVLALYLPLMALGLGLLVAMVRWTLQSRRPLHRLVTFVFACLILVGGLDWLRLGGAGPFEGVYLLAYALSGQLLAIGGMLVGLLATALRTSRELTQALDALVARRTADLEAANRQLTELSVTDALTGLTNRRGFDAALDAEWRRARRQGQPLALLMIDVDHFKSYNDQLGHPAGDACLQAVAQALRGCAQRSGDLAARYGGEEFVIIASNHPEAARDLADKVRRAVEAMDLPHPGGVAGRVTVSVGVASLWPGRDPATAADLLQRADAALFRAKAGGRNRVVDGSNTLPSRPTLPDR